MPRFILEYGYTHNTGHLSAKISRAESIPCVCLQTQNDKIHGNGDYYCESSIERMGNLHIGVDEYMLTKDNSRQALHFFVDIVENH